MGTRFCANEFFTGAGILQTTKEAVSWGKYYRNLFFLKVRQNALEPSLISKKKDKFLDFNSNEIN